MKLVRFNKFIQDTRGANLVEYVILVGVIAILVLGAARLFGKNLDSKMSAQAGQVSGINDTPQ